MRLARRQSRKLFADIEAVIDTDQFAPLVLPLGVAELDDDMASQDAIRRSFDQNLHTLLQRKRQLVRETLGSGEVSEDESLTLLRETIS